MLLVLDPDLRAWNLLVMKNLLLVLLMLPAILVICILTKEPPVMADQVKSGAHANLHCHGEMVFLCKRHGPWIPQSEQQSMERGEGGG